MVAFKTKLGELVIIDAHGNITQLHGQKYLIIGEPRESKSNDVCLFCLEELEDDYDSVL